MKTRKARGQVRRFFRRGIACLLALTGVAMAAVNAGVPLDWLGKDVYKRQAPWWKR